MKRPKAALGDAAHEGTLTRSAPGAGSRDSNPDVRGGGMFSTSPFNSLAKLCPCYFCTQGTCPTHPTLVTPLLLGQPRGPSQAAFRIPFVVSWMRLGREMAHVGGKGRQSPLLMPPTPPAPGILPSCAVSRTWSLRSEQVQWLCGPRQWGAGSLAGSDFHVPPIKVEQRLFQASSCCKWIDGT